MKLLLVATISAGAALCQQAQIAGLVRDPAGLSVSGAEITVRNDLTGGRRETRTNDSGFYSVASLNPGAYRILIRRTGFETIVREGVILEVGDNARLDFDLHIGDSRTIVTVHGGPPLMNTEDASIGTVIGRDIIDQMPLNGRGIQSLIELTPGVEAVPVISANSGQFSVNGQRSTSNYFAVDGVSANFGAGVITTGEGALVTISQAGGAQLPANNLMGTFSNLVSPDALQEFRIQTSTFAPEFGRTPGAQVEFVTRSGTSRYTGSLFEYFRNDVFDANDWFSNQQGLAKSALRFNNFGGTLAGAVRLPHFPRGDDRTFFFFSVEDLVMRQPQPPILFAVPDPQARALASPLSAPIFNALPLPNLPASSVGVNLPGWAGFGFGFSLPTDQQAWGLRIDHYFSDKLIGFARYNQAPSQQQEDSGVQPLTIDRFAAGSGMLTAGLTESASPALVNDVRANFSWQSTGIRSRFLSLDGAAPFPSSLLFPPGYSPQDSQVNITDVSNPFLGSLLVGEGPASRSRQIQVVDQLSYTRGGHQFKFGLDYRLFTLQSGMPKTATSYSFRDLSTAQVSYFDEAVTAGDVIYRTPALSLYAQDTWHALRRLTITYGLRWELEPAPRATSGDVSVYQPLPSVLDLSALSPAAPDTPFYRTQYKSFAPRIGLALQLLDNGTNKTVLRGGAGTFYDSAQSGFEDAYAAAQYLYSYYNFVLGSYPSGAKPDYGSGPEFAPVTTSGYAVPRTYEWNVTLEQAFGGQTVSAAYVGALGRRLAGSITGPPFVLPSTILPIGLEIISSDFSSSYNALQLQFNRRVSKRLQALLSYTWSHSIDNRSDLNGTSFLLQDTTVFLDPNQNRGDSDFDIRQSFHGALFFALPAPHAGRGAALLRNWAASSIFFARTAMPTNLLTLSSTVNDVIDVRPDIVPGQPLYLYGDRYPGGKSFNTAAFVAPPTGAEQGDLGRNALRGLGAWQVDFAVHREFRLSEHTSLQFRGEAFNLFNHPNFANPSAGTSPQAETAVGPYGTSYASLAAGLSPSGTLGQLNKLFQVGGPRSVQLALRLTF